MLEKDESSKLQENEERPEEEEPERAGEEESAVELEAEEKDAETPAAGSLEVKEEEGEEEAPSRRKEEKPEFVEEKIYTIPLRRAWIMPPNKRAPRAVRIMRAFIQRHMKVGEEALKEEGEEEGGKIIISNEVNEHIWRRGIEKPPRKLRVRAAKDEEGNVTIFLA